MRNWPEPIVQNGLRTQCRHTGDAQQRTSQYSRRLGTVTCTESAMTSQSGLHKWNIGVANEPDKRHAKVLIA